LLSARSRGNLCSRLSLRRYGAPAGATSARGYLYVGMAPPQGVPIKHGSGAGTPLRRSPSQSQPLHNRVIALRIVRAEVGQEPAPLPDHPQQPPSRMEVVFVRLEMLAEVIDPFGQTRDLDIRRPAVFGMPLKLAHRYLLRRFTLCAHLLHLHAPDPPALRHAGRSPAGAAGAPAIPPPSLTGTGADAWLQEFMITHSPQGWQTAGPRKGPSARARCRCRCGDRSGRSLRCRRRAG